MSQLHEYKAAAEWQGGRDGSGQVTSLGSGVVNSLSVPAEFGGPGAGTNPEELLASAVAGCYSMVFGIIAENRKVPLVSIKSDVVGEVEQQGMQFTYKKVTIRPLITLESSADDAMIAAVEEMAHKADAYCIITAAIKGKIEVAVEPTVVRA
jgi:peroxiredoxin-like protein